ncbi:unnamed protein product [Angiostrongylus costaricensis]|uniref:Uncharacterized protein n=1 Tax=Angiostrongylus costaricensis TaxID=334426 RepID=A0A0R3PIJ6_ANGCS|nr:unnamed protein product [Angiostrongylus costaricensis]
MNRKSAVGVTARCTSKILPTCKRSAVTGTKDRLSSTVNILSPPLAKTSSRSELHQTKTTTRRMRTTRGQSPSIRRRIANTTHLSTKRTKPDVRQVEEVRDEGKLLRSIFGEPPLEENSGRVGLQLY